MSPATIARSSPCRYDLDMHQRFRHRLSLELLKKRQSNPRYSLRAFAVFLGTDHSTLSQMLRGKRPIPASRIRSWAGKLGLEPEEATAYIVVERLPDAAAVERESQLRHWASEATAIIMERAHWQILELCNNPAFRPDCRWIAGQIGVTVDVVNISLSRLLRLGLLATTSTGNWTDMTGLPVCTEREFRKLALARVRQKAAEHQVKLPGVPRAR